MPNREKYNHNEWIDLIAAGNQSAFQWLFDHYRNKVFSIAIKLTRSTNIAEEIVEDVFMKIWLKRCDLHEIENFSAYLLAITRNECYAALRKIARHYRVSSIRDEESAFVNNDTEEYLAGKEYKQLLDSAINQLPRQQKIVFQLIKEQGLKRDEVANMLELSPETVKFHLSQAVKSLRLFCIRHLDIFTGFLIGAASLGNL